MSDRRILTVAIPLLTVILVGLAFLRGARVEFDAADLELVSAHPLGDAACAIVSVRHYDPKVQGAWPRKFSDVRVSVRAGEAAVQWHGDLNAEGVALVPCVDARAATMIDATVGQADGGVLFLGPVAFPTGPPMQGASDGRIRATHRGTLSIDLALIGSQISVNGISTLVGRVGVKGASERTRGPVLEVRAQEGLSIVRGPSMPDRDGWFDLSVRATASAAALTIHVEQDGQTGEVFAPLPVDVAGVVPVLPTVVRSGVPFDVAASAPDGRPLYASVRNADAVALFDLGRHSTAGMDRVFRVPALAKGLYWAAIATFPKSWKYGIELPFVVAESDAEARDLLSRLGGCPEPTPLAACVAAHPHGPAVATEVTSMAPVFVARAEERHVLSRRLALGAILVGGILECVLVWWSFRRERSAEGTAERTRADATTPAIILALVLTSLGFGLLAAGVAFFG